VSHNESTVTIEQAMQIAMQHHQAKRYLEAEKVYQAILHAHPRHAEANHNLGILLIQTGLKQQAFSYLKSALLIKPENGQFWLSLTECHVQLGKWEDARGLLEEARKKGLEHPAMIELRRRIQAGLESNQTKVVSRPELVLPDMAAIESLRESGKWQEAADAAKTIIERSPQRADAWAKLALVSPQLNNLDEADYAAHKALEIEPQNVEALEALAIIRLRQQRIDEASVLAEKVVANASGSPRPLMILGSVRMAQQRLEEAESLLMSALDLEPLAEVFANLGLLAMRKGELKAAISYAEQATSKKPFLVNVWQLLASLYLQDGQNEAATRALEQLIKYEPDNVAALTSLGESYRKAGKITEALAAHERVMMLVPDYLNGLINYGTALQDANRIEEAEKVYEKVLNISPNQAEVLNNLGVLYKQDGDWEKALAAFESASRFQPENMDIHANLGCALAQLGRLAEAEQALAIANHADSKNTGSKLGYSIIATQRNNREDAEKWLREAIATKPESTELWCYLGGLLVHSQRNGEAESAYRKALGLRRNFLPALQGLATVLLYEGNAVQALETSIRSLKLRESREAKNSFSQALKLVHFVKENQDARSYAAKAISESWTRPGELVAPAVSMVKLDRSVKACIDRAVAAWPERLTAKDLYGQDELATVAADKLLQCLLISAPASDVELEKFLTNARAGSVALLIKSQNFPGKELRPSNWTDFSR
jgi:tetratricopeptide (TPR) repeat protein